MCRGSFRPPNPTSLPASTRLFWNPDIPWPVPCSHRDNLVIIFEKPIAERKILNLGRSYTAWHLFVYIPTTATVASVCPPKKPRASPVGVLTSGLRPSILEHVNRWCNGQTTDGRTRKPITGRPQAGSPLVHGWLSAQSRSSGLGRERWPGVESSSGVSRDDGRTLKPPSPRQSECMASLVLELEEAKGLWLC